MRPCVSFVLGGVAPKDRRARSRAGPSETERAERMMRIPPTGLLTGETDVEI